MTRFLKYSKKNTQAEAAQRNAENDGLACSVRVYYIQIQQAYVNSKTYLQQPSVKYF